MNFDFNLRGIVFLAVTVVYFYTGIVFWQYSNSYVKSIRFCVSTWNSSYTANQRLLPLIFCGSADNYQLE